MTEGVSFCGKKSLLNQELRSRMLYQRAPELDRKGE